MRNRTILMAGLAPAALALGACGGEGGPLGPIEHLPRPLSMEEAELVRSGNDFSFSLLREQSRESPGENVFLSPLSASMALGMTANGALGETRDEMIAALGFAPLQMPEVNRAYRDLIALIRGLDSRVEMRIANSVWTQRGFPVEPGFLETVREYFDATAQEVNFLDVSGSRAVNEWVKQQTGGRIDRLLEERPDPDLLAFLANAIFFKGEWQHQFDPRRTRSATFHNQDGTIGSVRMMVAENMPLRFRQTPEYVAGELAYSRGAFAMTIVVPAAGTDLDAFVAALDAPRWASIVDGLADARLLVQLPRFKLEYESSLIHALQALGMQRAFTDSADFRGLTAPGGVLITEVLQKAMVEVTEEGTVAAAATGVSVGPTSMPPSLTVDRPFVFALRERLTGAILFVGKVGSLEAF